MGEDPPDGILSGHVAVRSQHERDLRRARSASCGNAPWRMPAHEVLAIADGTGSGRICKPNSVSRHGVMPGGRSFLWADSCLSAQATYPKAPSCSRSAKFPSGRRLSGGPPSGAFLFGLAPRGVYLAGRVTTPAGGLLPHRFTLCLIRRPHRRPAAIGRSPLCCTCRQDALAGGLPGCYPARCPTVFGLSSDSRPNRLPATARFAPNPRQL